KIYKEQLVELQKEIFEKILNVSKESYISLFIETRKLYHRIANVSKKSILIDSTKNIFRIYFLYKLLDDFKIIRLIRDGRSVYNSLLNKENIPFQVARAEVVKNNQFLDFWFNGLMGDKVYYLRYEDLCAHPEEAIKDMCDWIGVPFEENMLERKDVEYHFVGGSNSIYGELKNKPLKVNMEWEEMLTNWEVEQFNKMGDFQNKAYGYV
ncbi:MAG: sulfotransferase family protein, partial [Promethearchaeota archaeon]